MAVTYNRNIIVFFFVFLKVMQKWINFEKMWCQMKGRERINKYFVQLCNRSCYFLWVEWDLWTFVLEGLELSRRLMQVDNLFQVLSFVARKEPKIQVKTDSMTKSTKNYWFKYLRHSIHLYLPHMLFKMYNNETLLCKITWNFFSFITL